MTKPKVALVRGKYLNKYEMQTYEWLAKKYQLKGFGSLSSIHTQFKFPIARLVSPMDIIKLTKRLRIPNQYILGLLNRLMIDAHYLFGLEEQLKGFDIVHTAETYFHFTRQCLIAKKKGRVKKVVATVYENIPFNNEGIWGRKSWKEQAISEVNHFIAVSDETKDALIKEGCDSKKISIITPGINTDIFNPVERKSTDKKINILFVGRIERYKGIYDLIYSSKMLLTSKFKQEVRLSFTIVGEGSELGRIKELERNIGVDKFITHLSLVYDQMPQIYKQADIFIAPSQTTAHWQEQFSMALLEALSSGLPIVTTDTGSIRGTVADCALFVREKNPKELSIMIGKLVSNDKLRQEMEKKARDRAVKHFDTHIIADKIDKVYQKLI